MSETPLRLAELVSSLSLATDLGMGQPMEQAQRTCIFSVRVAHRLALREAEVSDVYYLALLRFIGCTSDAHEAALAAGGDEIGDHAGVAPVLMGEMSEFLRYLLRDFAAETPLLTRARLVTHGIVSGRQKARSSIAAHCEVAGMLAKQLGLPEAIGTYVGSTFERWDGKGLPGERAGEDIPLPARIVSVARDAEIFHRLGGTEMARDVLTRRKGKSYDPAVVEAALAVARQWPGETEARSGLEAMLDAEPVPRVMVEDDGFDRVLGAFASFTDMKTPYSLGHSPRVAELAREAARRAGLPTAAAVDVRRAGLVHDLGKAGVPNGILEKKTELSAAEWERMRLHPYLTERILAQSPALKRLAPLAGSHHERLDGSGYHRGVTGESLSMGARILAAANLYEALGEDRPHRPSLVAEERVKAVRAEADAGRLDPDAVRRVLEAAGQATQRRRRAWPNGLTDREVDVLRLVSRGSSNRMVAERLIISPKTVGRHVENIYGKINVSSRASAALFALQHDLLND
jgi:HD-GYP domain-containing protein (c-di-GMP phosphodiesterase class II)